MLKIPNEVFDWEAISWIVDVGLVYLLILKALSIIKGTRAEQMILGLGIVVATYLGSGYFRLATLHWILGYFLSSLILLIVVLFQEDIRRALVKVGLTPSRRVGKQANSNQGYLEEISQTLLEFSRIKRGAIIVLKRDVGLEDYTETAINIDSIVSRQLLLALFHPGSPLHDGAVVIENGRISAAGTVLPLSFSSSLSTSFGTRHRAAIGLSEKTDAIVLVVSEETGNVSLVKEGQVTKILNKEQLLEELGKQASQFHNKIVA